MNNRTLWTIVGVVLLVVIGLLVFGVISIPTTTVTPSTDNGNTSAYLNSKLYEKEFEYKAPAPAYKYHMAA